MHAELLPVNGGALVCHAMLKVILLFTTTRPWLQPTASPEMSPLGHPAQVGWVK